MIYSIIQEEISEDSNVPSEMNRSNDLLRDHLSSLKMTDLLLKGLTGQMNALEEKSDQLTSKIRQLHDSKLFLRECEDLVRFRMSVRNCVTDLDQALEDGKYEEAVSYVEEVNRVAHVKDRMKSLSDGETEDGKVLIAARNRLGKLIEEKFLDATSSGQLTNITRFAKLFKPIGLQERGSKLFIHHYGSQVNHEIEEFWKEKGDEVKKSTSHVEENGIITYVDLVHNVLDIIAGEVEDKEHLVQNYFGEDCVGFLVDTLYDTTDHWIGLVLRDFIAHRTFEVKKLSLGEMDILLKEISIILSKCEALFRFLEAKHPKHKLQKSADAMSESISKLILFYHHGNQVWMHQSIDKAIERNSSQKVVSHTLLSDADSSSESDNLSESDDDDDDDDENLLLNDIFYILRKSLTNAFDSMNYEIICGIIPQISTVLKRRIQDYFTQPFKHISSFKGTQYSVQDFQSFFSGFNDIYICSEYLQKLKLEVVPRIDIIGKSLEQREKITQLLADFIQVSLKFQETLKQNLSTLISSNLELSIDELIDPIKDISYVLTDDDFTRYEMNDPFMQVFTTNVDELMEHYQENLCQDVFDIFVELVCGYIVQKFYSMVTKKKYNQLGGLQLDKDFRVLLRYFGSKTNLSIRDKFSKLNQLSFILKFSKVHEILDYWDSETIIWKLKPEEIQNILRLRVDFPEEDIQKLQFD